MAIFTISFNSDDNRNDMELFYQEMQQYNVPTELDSKSIDDQGFYLLNPLINLEDVELMQIITHMIR